MEDVYVGEYKIGSLLGTGNFSKVRKATDSQGRLWAIKIINKSRLKMENMEDQMLREVAIMRNMRHRNIVKLKDVLQSNNHYFIVLEHVSGGELFDKIVAAKRFDEPTARKYFHQLIAGMYYCHSYGFAHRDLKPENLLLGENDTLKISDFGLSNLQQDVLLQTVCGTPNYVAPEVLMERGYNGLSADIWSCGVILYVMLAGRLPFESKNMNSLLAKIEHGEYQVIKHISNEARDLIARMMMVDPRKRISIEDVIKHPWFQVDWNPQFLESEDD
ncbi:unnamed protein product [Phytomonas sp. EM1]|nr:unnamed protein product [Phytomonas sp. EM1]|eukprot:CCW63022.1 unnamed protein product [Phytomonas sp. isolate EM1]